MSLVQESFDIATSPAKINGQLQLYTKEVNRLLNLMRGYQVDTRSSAEEATGFIGQCRSILKKIDATRKEILEPVKKFTNKVNDSFRIVTDEIDHQQKAIETKINDWKAIEEMRNQAKVLEAEALSEALEIDVIPVVQNETEKLRSAHATTYERTDWDYHVENLSMVPRDFLTLDESKVKSMLKLGVREIPGLKIFSKQKTIYVSR